MPTKVLIIVRGGVAELLQASDESVQVGIVDLDNIGDGDDPPVSFEDCVVGTLGRESSVEAAFAWLARHHGWPTLADSFEVDAKGYDFPLSKLDPGGELMIDTATHFAETLGEVATLARGGETTPKSTGGILRSTAGDARLMDLLRQHNLLTIDLREHDDFDDVLAEACRAGLRLWAREVLPEYLARWRALSERDDHALPEGDEDPGVKSGSIQEP